MVHQFSYPSWIGVIALLFALYPFVSSSPVINNLEAESTPPKPEPKMLTSRTMEHVKLRYVVDSGVCETTQGVHQMSGYIDVGKNMSMWFWFFESRHQPEDAPFTLWINGGPGCSSMIGLFQENGPCLVNADRVTTTLNPYSWNNISNMIYIDQPIGTGFSYGTNTVNSTNAAAPFIWMAFQILFESPEFCKFKSREFVFASESYGGHYAPAFIDYFNEQNALIEAGNLDAEKITVSAMVINNGWFDPLIHYKSYINFAANAPGYGPLQSESTIQEMNSSFYGVGGCKEQMEACYNAGTGPESNDICKKSDEYCIENIFSPAVGDLDDNDLRQKEDSESLFPFDYYIDFLRRTDIMAKIGAESQFEACSDDPFNLFATTGDDARTFLPVLSRLVRSGLKTLIWAGDADINCNWLGGYASVLAMDWPGVLEVAKAPFTNMTIDGKAVAAIKNYGKFSFARVYEAGHEVPAYKPQAAFEIFKQMILMEPLHSV